MTSIKKISAALLLIFSATIIHSCTNVFYGVSLIRHKECDTIQKPIKLRLVNVGEIGFSTLTLKTDDGLVTLQGLKPKDSSCYYGIPPIWDNAHYKISILRINRFGGAKGITLTTVETASQHDNHKKIFSGTYALEIELIMKKRKTYVRRFHLKKE